MRSAFLVALLVACTPAYACDLCSGPNPSPGCLDHEPTGYVDESPVGGHLTVAQDVHPWDAAPADCDPLDDGEGCACPVDAWGLPVLLTVNGGTECGEIMGPRYAVPDPRWGGSLWEWLSGWGFSASAADPVAA
jgi:hypothetical protein